MRFVEAFVRRETHVAINAEDPVPRVPDQRQPGFLQCLPDCADQLAKRTEHFGLVNRLARLEPRRVVVVAQLAEERERRRPEPGKPRWRFRHRASSPALLWRA